MPDASSERLSLFDRGPLFGLSHRAGLAHPDNPGRLHLAVALAAFAWVPLVALSAIQGRAWGPPTGSKVLTDWAVTGNLLIGMPLLIVLQTHFDRQLAWIARCFRTTGIVGSNESGHMDRLIASTTRLADSTLIEGVLVVVALVQSAYLAGTAASHGGLQWVFSDGGASGLSLAGWWAVCIATPLSSLVTVRWVWRVLLWWRFCWTISRLDLQIASSHPDGVGGLSFLNLSLLVYAVAAGAMLASAAGQFATRILATGAKQNDIQFQFLGGLLGVVVLFAGPLLLFTRPLARAKVRKIASYGALVCSQARAFDARWLVPGAGDAESLDQNDFSARTDLNTVAQLVYEMRVCVLTPKYLAILIVGAAAPFVPVAFLLLPAREILQGLVGLLF